MRVTSFFLGWATATILKRKRRRKSIKQAGEKVEGTDGGEESLAHIDAALHLLLP